MRGAGFPEEHSQSLGAWHPGLFVRMLSLVDPRRSPAPAIVSVHRNFSERTCFSLCFNRRLLPCFPGPVSTGPAATLVIRVNDEEGTKKARERKKSRGGGSVMQVTSKKTVL